MSGAALSDYGQRTLDDRRRLLGSLVQRLTGQQPSTERHRDLVEAAFAGAQHHQFADAAPRVVEELLDRLAERLGEHAQFGKQRALQLLRARLLETPVESAQYDFQHRLLAFLYAAARAPLSTHYTGGPLVDFLEVQARHAMVGPPTYLSDVSSKGSLAEQSGLYSPGSQLSEWSDEEAEGAEPEAMSKDGADQAASQAAAPASAAAAAPATAPAGSPFKTTPDAAALAAQVAGSLAKLFPPASRQGPRRETPYTRNSLSVWLASKQSGGQPARVLQPALCFHERELVQQVLHMLKGVASPGPAFQLDPVNDAYQPRRGVHLHCSSLGSARALLARFARCATSLRCVQAFCAAVARGGRPGGEPSGRLGGPAPGGAVQGVRQQQHDPKQGADGLPSEDDGEHRLLALPTVAAFASAVAEEEQALQQQVLVLEVACSSGALGSLLQLQQRTAGLAQQAELLAGLVRRCCARRGSAADSAAGLLSTLHDALQQQLLLARSQGGLLASMLLRIFAASCRPLLATLHKWLYQGLLEDPFEEFFVMRVPGPEVPTDSPAFWSEAFALRPASPPALTGGTAAVTAAAAPPAAPSFLVPLAASILAAGKSMLLLQAYSSWRLAASGVEPLGATAMAAREHPASAPAGPAVDEGPPSPAKRRLSELGALGFAVAADPARQQQQPGQERRPYGAGGGGSVPPPALAARAGDWKQQIFGQEGGDDLALDPPQLHRQLLEGLQSQLEEKLALSKRLHQQQQLEAQQLGAAAACGSHAVGSRGSEAGTTSSGRVFRGDWQQPAAACGDHALQLPAQDTLAPLPELPATPDGLPAASLATISPAVAEDADDQEAAATVAPPAGAGAVGKRCSSAGCGGSGESGELPIGERMRQAARARASQAAGAAAAQLPLLIIPPAPLGACLEAAPSRADRAVDSGGADPRQAAAEQGPGGEAVAPAVQFDSASWQAWYQQTAAALSRQLHVLDCLGPQVGADSGGSRSSSGSGGKGTGQWGGTRKRPLAGSFGVPLGLPTARSGSACDQLWGRASSAGRSGSGAPGSNHAGSALGSGDAAQQRRDQPGLAAEAPPLGVLLDRSLLQPIQAQVDAAGGALCAVLLRRGLLRQLSAMQEVYLVASPLLEPFVAFLLRRISTASGGLDRVSEFELNAALQDALAAGAAGTAGAAGAAGAAARAPRAAARILPPPPEAQQAQQAQAIPQRVHALARLCLRVEPGWPLSLLVGEEMLGQYNRVLVLLLQLRWVKQSLQSVRYQGWKAGRRASQAPAARDGLQHQMVHLVDSVLQYMTDRVVAAGAWLEQAVAASASLEEMHRCRAKYLRAVTRYCLLSPEGVARLVHEGLLHLLNACLQYCALRRQQDAVAAALAHLSAQQQRQQQGAGAEGTFSGVGPSGASEEEAEEEAGAAGGAGRPRPGAPAGLPRAGRRGELARRGGELRAALGALRRDWSNRQRLLLRVLAAKAAEAGSHADELRQLLGALDFSRHFEASMA